jgi:hypothetical protein
VTFGGGDAYYAPMLEFGIPRMGKKPFLRPAEAKEVANFHRQCGAALGSLK